MKANVFVIIHSLNVYVTPCILAYVDFCFQSPGLNVTMEEIKVLLDNYDSQHNLASTGFHLGGQKYFYLRYLKITSTLINPHIISPLTIRTAGTTM